jgi:hypothetical protein
MFGLRLSTYGLDCGSYRAVLTRRDGNLWLRQTKGQVYASDRGRKLEPNNLKGTKLGSPSWENGPESGPCGELRVEFSRCSGLLRTAQARNSLTQPQLRAAYSWLRLQSRVLRSRSENGIWREVKIGVQV